MKNREKWYLMVYLTLLVQEGLGTPVPQTNAKKIFTLPLQLEHDPTYRTTTMISVRHLITTFQDESFHEVQTGWIRYTIFELNPHIEDCEIIADRMHPENLPLLWIELPEPCIHSDVFTVARFTRNDMHSEKSYTVVTFSSEESGAKFDKSVSYQESVIDGETIGELLTNTIPATEDTGAPLTVYKEGLLPVVYALIRYWDNNRNVDGKFTVRVLDLSKYYEILAQIVGDLIQKTSSENTLQTTNTAEPSEKRQGEPNNTPIQTTGENSKRFGSIGNYVNTIVNSFPNFCGSKNVDP